jgi:hypothetical protein
MLAGGVAGGGLDSTPEARWVRNHHLSVSFTLVKAVFKDNELSFVVVHHPVVVECRPERREVTGQRHDHSTARCHFCCWEEFGGNSRQKSQLLQT